MQIGGGHGDVFTEAEGIVLINPGIIAGLGAVLADVLKARAWILIKSPSLGTVIPCRLRAIQRTFALSSIKACKMTARKRRPDNALFVDVCAANTEPRQGHVVDFRERGLGRIRTWIYPYDGARESAHGTPHEAVGWIGHDGVESRHDTFVLGRIHRLIWLDIIVALAVTISVQDQRCPALRFRGVTGLVENLHVEPADDGSVRTTGARPEPVIGVELQMMRVKAGIDERILHGLRIEHRELTVRALHRKHFR